MMKKTKINRLIRELEKINHYGTRKILVQLKKEVNVYLSCNTRQNILEKKIKQQLRRKSKIQIGGGKNYLLDFINIDISKPADIIYDVRNGIPLPSNCINFIFTEHFLEHIDYPISVLNFFSEAYRVLRNNGKFVVSVPDTKLIATAYVKNNKKLLYKIKNRWYSKRSIIKNIDSGIDIVNLVIRDEYANKKYTPHFWGYDEKKLKQLFIDSGFKNIKKWSFNKEIANIKRRFGSIYIEGTKK